MTVTVTVSMFNAAAHLERCIENIRSQTYMDIEIIFVVDSKTTDDTLEILKDPSYADIKVIVQYDSDRQSGARNIALDSAKGEYIWFLDVDDFFSSTLLEETVGIAERTGCDIAVFNHYYTNTPELIEPDGDNYTTREFTGAEACIELADGHIPMQSWSKIYRTGFLKENRIMFSSEHYSEDFDHTAKAFLCASKVIYYNKPLYTYYLHDASCSAGAGDSILKRDIQITGEMLALFKEKEPELYGEYCSASLLHILHSMTNATDDGLRVVKDSQTVKECIRSGKGGSPEILLYRISPRVYYSLGKAARKRKFSKGKLIFNE